MPRELRPRARRRAAPAPSPNVVRREPVGPAPSPAVQLARTAGARDAPRGVQRKVSVGRSDDPQESEADRVASNVVQRAATGVDDRVSRATDEETVQAKDDDESVARKEDEVEVRAKTDDEAVARSADDDVQRDPIHEEDERPGGRLRLTPDDEVQREEDGGGDEEPMDAAAERAVAERGGGEPLDPSVRGPIEGQLGRDLGGVRVHRDGKAQASAKALKAKAFTHKDHIWLGAGQSPRDLRLMAHEATHVVQQGAAPARGEASSAGVKPSAVQRAEGGPTPQALPEKAPEGDVAPGPPVELKGKSTLELGEEAAAHVKANKGGKVRVQYGELAKGALDVKPRGSSYSAGLQGLPINLPIFAKVEEATGLAPKLLVEVNKGKVSGHIGLHAALSKAAALADELSKTPGIVGLSGLSLDKLKGKVRNELKGGKLTVGLEKAPLSLGKVLKGDVTVLAIDDNLSVAGSMKVVAKGLAEGTVNLSRDENGLFKGDAEIDVVLPGNWDGKIKVAWDGQAFSGAGDLGYTGEKLSGKLHLEVMEKAKALGLEAQKKAAAGEDKKPKGKGDKKGLDDFVVYGDGLLDFSFTEWLTGKAQVIVDPKGHVTIIGEITPQKEFELFPQKDYVKKLFKVEVRAAYGVPVVGNIFVFANVGMDAFAKIGPAKFYNIVVEGTYSTDPEKSKSFSIRGSLNMGAAAGLRLRGEAGAGIEILDHDLKAGGGVNAMAGIKGYAEATPIIGYREKPTPDKPDKKGEFFLRGEVEIAARPFLELGGDLFVEVDSPWWSPLPDKKWTWPLGSKEYPIGGDFGIGADVDYVFGSGKAPAVEFKPVEFSSDKFFTDLMNDKTAPKSGKKDQAAKWKEKNSKDGEPPKGGKKGATEGKLPEKGPAKAGPMKKVKGPAADPKARTADGKTVEQHKKEASQRGKQPGGEGPQGAEAGASDKGGKLDDAKKKKLVQAVASLKALNEEFKGGVTKEALDDRVQGILAKHKDVLKKAEVIPGKGDWDFRYTYNPTEVEDGPAQLDPDKVLDSEVGKPNQVKYTPGSIRAERAKGLVKGEPTEKRSAMPTKAPGLWGADAYLSEDDRGHLIAHRMGGASGSKNLVPQNKSVNRGAYRAFEAKVATFYDKKKEETGAARLEMDVQAAYPSAGSFRPTKIDPVGKVHWIEPGEKKPTKKEFAESFPNPEKGVQKKPTIYVSEVGDGQLGQIPGFRGNTEAIQSVLALRAAGTKLRTWSQIKGLDEAKANAEGEQPVKLYRQQRP